MLKQGKDLIAGERAICVSSTTAGIISNSPEFLVLSTTDKKGNVQVANFTTGEVVSATSLSVWDVWSAAPAPPISTTSVR
jgi:hypothetical protein